MSRRSNATYWAPWKRHEAEWIRGTAAFSGSEENQTRLAKTKPDAAERDPGDRAIGRRAAAGDFRRAACGPILARPPVPPTSKNGVRIMTPAKDH